jgi:hypothetical protein
MTTTIRREPYTLHGYTIRCHGYCAWTAERPDGTLVTVTPTSVEVYHKTLARVRNAVKRDRSVTIRG